MKKCTVLSLCLIAVIFFVPWLLGEDSVGDTASVEETPPAAADPLPEKEEPPEPAGIAAGERDGGMMLRVLIGGEVREMDMGTYLVGVVRAEMPASFEMEALKAQAVAARTYTLHKMMSGGCANHPHADACDDITCCKAYMDEEAAARLWGDSVGEYEDKIRRAVTETDGECVLYEGSPALAVFHSSSAGMTMDAGEVWSGDVPYLRSVTSPESADTVPNFHSRAVFAPGELKEILLAALPEARLETSPTEWFTNIRQKENGTVTALDVGGESVSGSRLREILGLRSACFTLDFEESGIVFSVTGYGHGVGMSQYGANVLAASGMDYREILAWYYTDTQTECYMLS